MSTTTTEEVRVLWRAASTAPGGAWITARTPVDVGEAGRWARAWRANDCEVRIETRTVTVTETPWDPVDA